MSFSDLLNEWLYTREAIERFGKGRNRDEAEVRHQEAGSALDEFMDALKSPVKGLEDK